MNLLGICFGGITSLPRTSLMKEVLAVSLFNGFFLNSFENGWGFNVINAYNCDFPFKSNQNGLSQKFTLRQPFLTAN